MPDISAYADAFREWEKLIGILDENGALVPGHEAQKAGLAATLEEARQLKIQQESLAGNRLAATDRFLNKVDEGRQKFSQLRSFIVSVLGPRSPQLPLFGIRPKPEKIVNPNLLKRKARAETSTKPPTNPPAPASQTAKAAEPEKAKD